MATVLPGFEPRAVPLELQELLPQSVVASSLMVYTGTIHDAALCTWALRHTKVTDQWVVRKVAGFIRGWREVGAGDVVFVLDTVNTWYPAVVAAATGRAVFIHYFSWARYDEWIPRESPRLEFVPQHVGVRALRGRLSNHSCRYCTEMAATVPPLKTVRWAADPLAAVQRDCRWRYPATLADEQTGDLCPPYEVLEVALCLRYANNGVPLHYDDLRRVFDWYQPLVARNSVVAARSRGIGAFYRPAIVTSIERNSFKVHILGQEGEQDAPLEMLSSLRRCTDLSRTQRHVLHDCPRCELIRQELIPLYPLWPGQHIVESHAITLRGDSPETPAAEHDTRQAADDWATQLSELENMGFTDREVNTQMLQQANGDVNEAVELLLQQQE